MFLFTCLCESVKITTLKVSIPGFYSLKLDSGSTFNLNLENKTAYFIGNVKDYIDIQLNGQYYNFPYYKQFTEVGGNNFTLEVLKNTTLSFWVIDSFLCDHAIYIETEYMLNTLLTSIPNATCFFTQLDYSESNLEIQDYPDINVDFYNSLKISEPVKTCVNNETCTYVTSQQYYIRVINPENRNFTLKYKVIPSDHPTSSKTKVRGCALYSSDNFIATAPLRCPKPPKQSSYSSVVISLFVCLIVLAIIYKFFGKHLCPSNEALLFENLKRDPYATPLEKPNEINDDNFSSSAV